MTAITVITSQVRGLTSSRTISISKQWKTFLNKDITFFAKSPLLRR